MFLNLRDYITAYSEAQDHTPFILKAIADSTAQKLPIFAPAGVYNYNKPLPGLTQSLIGQGKDVVRFNNNGVYGKSPSVAGARLDITGDNVTVSGISFYVTTTPATAVNDADEQSIIIRATGCKNAKVKDCDFYNAYGAVVLYRSVVGGEISGNTIYTCYKDGFHITGLSSDIIRKDNVVYDGGDDAFAVVGYASTGTIGQPTNIIDINNKVFGVKSARGFAYVGCKGVINRNSIVDGFIPAQYGRNQLTQSAAVGCLIFVDGSVDSFGNDDIYIEDMTVLNCGRALAGRVYGGAYQVQGSGTRQTTNITFSRCKAKRSIRRGFFCGGNVANLKADIEVFDTTDPAGIESIAGSGTNHGIEIQGANGVTVIGCIGETGGGGIYLTNSCQGVISINVKTKNINKSGNAALDICQVANPINPADVSIRVEAVQPTVTAGSPYYFGRVVNTGRAKFIKQIAIYTP